MPTWTTVLTIVMFGVYLAVGMWLIFGIDYAIGDALARSAAARSIVDSRDQHLMGVGFYWMPIPTFAQVPFMAVFSRVGVPELSLPFTTAVAGALTIPPLVATGRALGLRDRVTFIVVVLYAFNPYTVWFAANGMSEAWSSLFLAYSVKYLVRWMRDGRNRDLGGLGIALAFTVLAKYESFGAIPLIAFMVAVRSRPGRRLSQAMAVALPAMFAFGVWFATSVIISGKTPFETVFGNAAAESNAELNQGWLPSGNSFVDSLRYVVRLTMLVAPGVLLALLLSGFLAELVRAARSIGPKRHTAMADLSVLGVVSLFLVYPGQVGYLLMNRRTYGNPRYFTPLVLCLACVSLIAISRTRGFRRVLVAVLLIAATGAGYVSNFATLSNPLASRVEGEYTVIERLLGRNKDPRTPLNEWREFTAKVDALMGPDDLLAVDSGVAHQFTLLTTKPNQVVLDRDKDSEALVSRNPSPFTMIVYVRGARSASVTNEALIDATNRPPRGKRWELQFEGPGSGSSLGTVEFYRLVDVGDGPATPAIPTPSTSTETDPTSSPPSGD